MLVIEIWTQLNMEHPSFSTMLKIEKLQNEKKVSNVGG